MHFATPIAQDPDSDAEKVGLAYFRTATTGKSYSDQLARCRACWEREGITIGATFLDYGVAASVPLNRRNGFLGLMVRLRRGDVSWGVVDEASRIARDPVRLFHASRVIEAQGAILLTADGHRIGTTDLRMSPWIDLSKALGRSDQ
jgi:hypothetical protein